MFLSCICLTTYRSNSQSTTAGWRVTAPWPPATASDPYQLSNCTKEVSVSKGFQKGLGVDMMVSSCLLQNPPEPMHIPCPGKTIDEMSGGRPVQLRQMLVHYNR